MRLSRRAVLKGLIATGVGSSAALGYGYGYERHALTLTQANVPVVGLPTSLSGLRIGLLTDLHRSSWVSAADVEAAVQMLLGTQPDVIVLGGDYVTWGDRQFVEPAAAGLQRLSAPHGVFAVLGNHDDDHDMPAALAARGIQVLKDARTKVVIGGDALEFAGIRFWTRKPADIETIVRGAKAPVILLAHDPRRVTEAAALGIPLVLSGHTHGGQVVLPALGAIAAEKFPIASGILRRGGTTLFVSRGVGTVYMPVRINCPPEVALLTLQPAV